MDLSGLGEIDIARTYEKYYNSSYTPSPGDTVFYRWASGDYHTGIVLFSDPNSEYVYTIEGNTLVDKKFQVAIKCRSKD
jgi:hypothetical protein